MMLLSTPVGSGLAALLYDELPLNPAGQALEIHADDQNNLWITEYTAGEIWQVNASGAGYSVYNVEGNPGDATPDNLGGVWWVDTTSLRKLDTTATPNTIETWEVTGSGMLYGLAIDSLGRVWLADSDYLLPNIYRFNPSNRELCTYPLPDGGQGFYPAASGSQAWIGDVINGRLVRFGDAQIDWWVLPEGSSPQDIDIDASGNIWYVDFNLGQLGRLNPIVSTNNLTMFTLPTGSSPFSIAESAGKVWYTEISQLSVGILDPGAAEGVTDTASTGFLSIAPQTCPTLSKPSSRNTSSTPDSPAWSSGSYPTLVDSDGWRIFQLPPGSSPWGIEATDYGWMVDYGRQVLAKLTQTTLAIVAEKTPNLISVPETGGNVTFTFKVTNTSDVDAVTITSLSDSDFGTLAGDGDCMVGTILSPGGFCEFSSTEWVEGNFTGPSHTNTFTVHAEDPDHIDVSAGAQAEVTFTNVLPSLEVTKTANPTSVPETGGSVTFTFTVKNASSEESVTISELSDSIFGPLTGGGDCGLDTALAAGASCGFSIIRPVAGDFGGPVHANTFTAKAKDDDNSEATATAQAEVNFSDVLPDITVTKAANPNTVAETGGSVTFTYTVANHSAEAAEITVLSDDKFGALTGDGDCHEGIVLAGTSGTCSFQVTFAVPSGDVPGSHVNIFSATVSDGDGNTDMATDNATVTYTDVKPDITVTKTANPTSIPETGGQVTFTYSITNNSPEAARITVLSDNRFGPLAGDGDCHVDTVLTGSGGSCSFEAAFSVPAGDFPGSHGNTFTATVTDGDDNNDTATAQATVIYTDVLPDLTVLMTAAQATVPLDGASVTYTFLVTNHSLEPATITVLKVGNTALAGSDTCRVSTLLPGNGSCSFQASLLVPVGQDGGTHTKTFTASVTDGDGNNDTATDDETVTYAAGSVWHYVYLPMIRR